MIFWLGTIFLLACQTAGTELGKAIMLEQDGNAVGALEIYTTLLKEYPNSPEAKTSLRRVQRLQLKTAKELEGVDTKRALAMYLSIAERWPDSDYARIATQKVQNLKGSAVKESVVVPKSVSSSAEQMITQAIDNALEVDAVSDAQKGKQETIVDEAELAACDTARQRQSRVVWQQYKQTFPEGTCIDEAEAFLEVVVPRQMELDQAKEKASEVFSALQSLCQEYRLVQTTSNPKACQNPSQALMTEFARLEKRKADLLGSGEPDKLEYYEKWIPPRWNKLSNVETQACAPLLTFLDKLETQGIDRSAVTNELTKVETCFVTQGSITD